MVNAHLLQEDLCHTHTHAAAAKSLQSCPTLCNPIDGSPSGSPIPGILQARTLEWVAISSSNAWTWKVKVELLTRVRLLATPWTAAHQAPPSMEFSRQEYWSGVPLYMRVPLFSIIYFPAYRMCKMYIHSCFWIWNLYKWDYLRGSQAFWIPDIFGVTVIFSWHS